MSKMINEAGRYQVTIRDPYWEDLEAKNGDTARMCLVLPCHTEDDQVAYYRFSFTQTLVSSGRNSGRKLCDVSAEQCIALGMADPFDPGNIGQLNGAQAELVMDVETFNNKERVAPKYLNPVHKKRLSMDEAQAIWDQMTGGRTPKAGQSEDDLGF